jgi:phospholipase D1/2
MQTMKMMYGVIAAALSDVGLLGEHHPCDYLNFYCLGNREPESPQEGQPMNSPENSKHVSGSSNLSFLHALKYKLLLVQKRFQIIQALVCR